MENTQINGNNEQQQEKISQSTGVKASGLDFIKLGRDDAIEMLDSSAKAQGFQRERLMLRASELASDEVKRTEWLDGFGSVMGKVKKSEAKSVFMAYIKDKDQVVKLSENVGTGYVKDDDTKGVNAYQRFISACRNIKGTQSRAPQQRAAKAPTDKQMAELTDRAQTMTDKQTESLLEKALPKLTPASAKVIALHARDRVIAEAKDQWELLVMREIDELATRLVEDSKNPEYVDMAKAIIEVGHQFLANKDAEEAQRIALAESAKKQVAGQAEVVAVPQPAVVNG